jgi:ectoine hydroxylase-related dioxygenase (phytanoyl-CoA dioxygenase family)
MLEESLAADIAAALWGTADVWFMYEQVFLKQGGKSRRTPWHQDSSYLPVDGENLAVMWIPFEPLAKENSLELVRRSHRGTLYNGSRFDIADDTAPIYPEQTLPRLPNIEADRARWDIVSWAMTPGDILVFHPAMLHGGAPTLPSQRRRTLSLRFFGADTVYAPRIAGGLTPSEMPTGDTGEPSEPVFRKLPRTLTPGAPFRHPDFLKVRPRGVDANS